MAKPVLGRDLGALMGRKPAGGVPRPAAGAGVGGGVGSLLRGQRPHVPDTARKGALPRFYLFAGDILLVALALVIFYKSPRPVSWKTEVFCVTTVGLAAVLGVIAVSMREGKPPDSGPFK